RARPDGGYDGLAVVVRGHPSRRRPFGRLLRMRLKSFGRPNKHGPHPEEPARQASRRMAMGDQYPTCWNVVGAGLTMIVPVGVISLTARPRSTRPSGRKRKMPSTPEKPLASVRRVGEKRLSLGSLASVATSATPS